MSTGRVHVNTCWCGDSIGKSTPVAGYRVAKPFSNPPCRKSNRAISRIGHVTKHVSPCVLISRGVPKMFDRVKQYINWPIDLSSKSHLPLNGKSSPQPWSIGDTPAGRTLESGRDPPNCPLPTDPSETPKVDFLYGTSGKDPPFRINGKATSPPLHLAKDVICSELDTFCSP